MTLRFWDFDGTLLNSPLPEEGKPLYEKLTNSPYPYKGWWGKHESLFHGFDIKPIGDVYNLFTFYKFDDNCKNVLLTNRMKHLKDDVLYHCDKHGLQFDLASFKYNNQNKAQRMVQIYSDNYLDADTVVLYDDDKRHLDDVIELFGTTHLKYECYHVNNGIIIPYGL